VWGCYTNISLSIVPRLMCLNSPTNRRDDTSAKTHCLPCRVYSSGSAAAAIQWTVFSMILKGIGWKYTLKVSCPGRK